MKWPHHVEITVPWRDIDAAGHVNNAVYLSYMETARCDAYLHAKGVDPATVGPEGIDIILARIACDFRAPAQLGDVLRVSVRPTRVGASSFALAYEIRNVRTGELVAEGESVQVCFDYAKNEKKAVAPQLRAALEAGLAATKG